MQIALALLLSNEPAMGNDDDMRDDGGRDVRH